MRVSPYLFLFLEAFEQEGGIQSYIQDFLCAYGDLEDVPPAVVFLLRDRLKQPGSSLLPNIKLRSFWHANSTVARLRLAIALLWFLLTQRPRRVFCGHVYLATLVAICCIPLRVPYTVITYGKEAWEPLPFRFRLALRHASQIWTISRYTRDRTCAANRLSVNQFRLLPCSVDGNRFSPGSKSLVLLEQYGLMGARVLLTVARLWSGDRYKGVDVTIQALPAIAQVIPTVKYLVIGRGDDQPRLAALAKELQVADRVVFAGFVPTVALPDHYRLADAYVMPSQEGFGVVYLEAMACGIPVLAGDSDGSADPLQDGQMGWRVAHRDPTAVATACIEMLQCLEQTQLPPPAPASLQLTSSSTDLRCDRYWLRQRAIATFGKATLPQRLRPLLATSDLPSNPEPTSRNGII